MMSKSIFILGAVLLAGGLVAEEVSESVQGILNQLQGYQSGGNVEAAPVEAAPVEAVVAPAPAVVEETVTEVEDVDAVLEESRQQFLGGKFAKAQEGFARVVDADPANKLAKMYLRTLNKYDHQRVKKEGLKEVNDDWDNGMIQRSYKLDAAAREKMEFEEVDGVTDVTALFPEVKFPKGSSALYNPEAEMLYVRNVDHNFVVLETILEAMDALKLSGRGDQVEIEAKFVEVAQGALEELGFEWNFANNVQTGIDGQDIIVNDQTGLFAEALRGSSLNPDLPFDRQADLGDGQTAAPAGDWTTFRMEDAFSSAPDSIKIQHQGHNPLEVLISALDQQNGSDVLSAPRVVTKNGETAVIRVGQLHAFPEVYEVGANEGNILHVMYQDFEEKLLGVELEVTPKVKKDQITLELAPEVSELIGWQNYEVAPQDSAYTYYQFRINEKFYHDPINARLPIFKKRSIRTSVTIQSGSTIGMGGLINEKTEAYEDKVPLLGNIPLVGRLFRNEGERAIKRNLLMFVKATKVEPSGRISTSRSFE